MVRRWLRRSFGALCVGAGLVVLAVAASACSGPATGVAGLSTTSTTTAAPRTAKPASDARGGALAEYAACMRTHGVDAFPDPATISSDAGIKNAKSEINGVAAGEGSSPRFQAAERSCRRYAPTSGTPTRPTEQQLQRLLAVSRCMRSHAVPDFPDPNPTTGELTTPSGLDKSAPQVVAALRACSALARAAGLGPPTT